jgi:hypothetical protein
MTAVDTTTAANLSELKKRVRSLYLETGHDRLLAKHLDELLMNAEDCQHGVGSRRRLLFVIGGSGTGKTTSLKHHFARHEEFRPRVNKYGEMQYPLLSIKAPEDCSAKELAKECLNAMGLPSAKGNEVELFRLLKSQLKERGIRFLHVDEMQHVIRYNTQRSIQGLQDTLKSLSDNDDWPLHAIYSGVDSLSAFLTGDQQLANRSAVIRFKALSFPGDRNLIERFLREIAVDACGLSLPQGLLDDEFFEKLCRASGGGVGTMIEKIQDACFLVIQNGRTELTMKVFSERYARDTGCQPGDNAFTSKYWREVVVGNALADLADVGLKTR